MKPPAGLELIHLYNCLIGKRGCILNLIKIMIDDRKIVIFPFGKGGGGEVKPPSGLEYIYLYAFKVKELTFSIYAKSNVR